MRILSAITGVTFYDKEFSAKISSLIVRVANASGYALLSDLKGLLWIHSPHSGKKYTAFDKMSLIKLAELCSMDQESSIKIQTTATLVEGTPNTITVVANYIEYRIDLTADGKGIELMAGEEWRLELTGMAAGDAYNVWAVESSETTTKPVTYGVFSTGTKTNEKFNLSGFDRVYIDRNGALSNVEIADAFGVIKKETDELEAEIRNGYGAVYSNRHAMGNHYSTYSINEGLFGYLIPWDGKSILQVNASGSSAIEIIGMKWD